MAEYGMMHALVEPALTLLVSIHKYFFAPPCNAIVVIPQICVATIA